MPANKSSRRECRPNKKNKNPSKQTQGKNEENSKKVFRTKGTPGANQDE